MIRSLPSMTTTVSSEWEMGRKYGYRPTAWSSRALVKVLHLSNNATCCRVSVYTGPPGRGGEKAAYMLVAVIYNRKGRRDATLEHRSATVRKLRTARFEGEPHGAGLSWGSSSPPAP